MRAVLLVAVLSVFLVGYFALVHGSDDQPAAPNTSQQNAAAVIDQLVAFARSPASARASALPFAGEVELGLADRLLQRRSAGELSDPDVWELDANLFRAGGGPFSALRLLAQERGRLTVSVVPHRHCVSPPVPPPPRVASLRRVSVQPRDFSELPSVVHRGPLPDFRRRDQGDHAGSVGTLRLEEGRLWPALLQANSLL